MVKRLVSLSGQVLAVSSPVSMFVWLCVGKKVQRGPGDRWMIHGPAEFIPRTEIGNIQKRLD